MLPGSQAYFSKRLGKVGESGSDQMVRAHPSAKKCATHNDGPLTIAESLERPPILDTQSALFLDLDGTLLEIAAQPELVCVPRGLAALIASRAKERDGAVALISGRPLAELDQLLRPWHGAAAGLHGIERRRADGSPDQVLDPAGEAALDRIRPKLAAVAGDGSGLVLEDKGGTIALHYRAVPEREAEIRAYAETLLTETKPALRLIAGKMVVEFQPSSVN